jgi:hypothetical protein
MSIDGTTGWDRHAAIRHAIARLECLPNAEQWSHDVPVTPDERAAFSPTDRESLSLSLSTTH